MNRDRKAHEPHLAARSAPWAVGAFGGLAVVATSQACSPTVYTPAIPRTASQAPIDARVDALREESTRHLQRISVDVTVHTLEPIEITTARLAPRSASSCEGGVEASAIVEHRTSSPDDSPEDARTRESLASTWDRWSRVPLSLRGEARLHITFDGHEPAEKLATEPSDLDIGVQGPSSRCVRLPLVGPEPELAWRDDAHVILDAGLRYDGFFGAPSGIQGLFSIPIELVVTPEGPVEGTVQLGAFGFAPCSVADCGRDDRGKTRAGVAVPLGVGAKAWLLRNGSFGVRGDLRYEMAPLAMPLLHDDAGHLVHGPRFGLRWSFALPPMLYGMARGPQYGGLAIEPEIGLVRDGFSSGRAWSFVLGLGVLAGSL